MDTLELVPFEGTKLHCVEDFDASKFHIKELRIKDLHKNLCKKPYFHVRLDSHKRDSGAERAEPNGEQYRSSLVTSDGDYETCEDNSVASAPQDSIVPAPSEIHSEEFPAADQQPSHRTSKREKRLPGKFRQDGNSLYDDFPERYLRYYRRGVSKSKVKRQHPLPEKPPEVNKPDHTQTQFFEVPIEAHEVDELQCDATATTSGGERMGLGSSKVADAYPSTPSERKAPTRPLKQIYHSPSSSQKRAPTTKHPRVNFDYSECMEISTDTEPHERPSRTTTTISSRKWKHHSPDANTEEIVSAGKRRTFDSKFKENTSRNIGSTTLKEKISSRTMGSEGKEKKGSRPLKNEMKRTFSADGSIEEILPMGWRLNSPDPGASAEEILPTEKKRTLERKLKEKESSRTIESKGKEKNGRSLERESNRSYNNIGPQPASTEETLSRKWRYNSPDASTEKRTLESKSKEKKARNTDSKWNEKKGSETESKWRNGTPDASAEDILPMKWRLPQQKWPLDGLWKEKNNSRTSESSRLKEKTARTAESGSKQHRFHAPDISTQRVLPVKRKHSYFDASMEEILSAQKKKTHHIKLKEKKSKTPESSCDVSKEETTLPAEKKKAPDSKLKQKKSRTPEGVSLDASIEENLAAERKTPDSKLKDKKSKTTPESKSKIKKGKEVKPSPHVRTPIRKLKSGYTSGDGSSDVERDAADGPGTSFPTFATEMKHSNVVTCFWMGIPADFTSRHMPDHDMFVVLQDAKGLKWETNYLARKKGLSGGWRRFSLDHHLEMGDIVVFELVKPLKFLVHITKGVGGENPSVTVHQSVSETSKKALKHRASSPATKRVSSLESALFSTRKRVNKDAEGKLPSKKPHLAGGNKQQREGEERVSVLMTPAAKLSRPHNSGGSKKERQSASKDTDHYEDHSAPLRSEESDGPDELETRRGTTPPPKFKRMSSTEYNSRDSKTRTHSPELRLTVYENSSLVSSPEPQKPGLISPKPGPPKKKLRRVSYFYSTDEDQGHSIST